MDIHTCETCGKRFKPRQRTKPNRYCSLPCYHQAMRGVHKVEKPDGRMRRVYDHPLAPPSGIVAIARLNLYEKIGPGKHPCHWCGTELEWVAGAGPISGAIMADHLNYDRTDDSIDNLVPACTQCNAHRTKKGDRRLVRDDELYVTVSRGARTRAVERTCRTCGVVFLAIPALVRKGGGIYCSPDCMYRRNQV